MTEQEELAAYRAMRREVETLYADAVRRLEEGRAAGREKTAGYREALGWKIYYKNVLDLYAWHGLRGKEL